MSNDLLARKLLHTAGLNRDDEALLLAMDIYKTQLDGDFEQWLERTIEMNTDNLTHLISTLMDVAVIIHSDNFKKSVQEFIGSGRFRLAMTASEVNPS